MTDTDNALVGEVVDNPPQQALTIAGNPYISMIQSIVAQGGDMTALDRILDLQIKWEGNEARKAYVSAMADFKADPMEIGKNKHVSYRNNTGGNTAYDHAELSDVTDVVVPGLAKHGFSHAWKVTQAANGITVVCTITHRLGHSESVEMTAPPDSSGGKNTIQAIASTKTYLERYTLLAATGLATKGQDNDGRGDTPDGKPPAAEPSMSEKKTARWLEAAGKIADMPQYEQQRTKMMKEYGGKTASVPREVKSAFAAAKAKVEPKD